MAKVNGEGQATVFSRNELDKFFKVVKNDSRYWYTLFKFLYYSGERSGCAIQTKWDDINLSRNLITFRPETRKGNQSRKPLNIHPELHKILIDAKKFYISEFGAKTVTEIKYVFCGLKNEFNHVSRSCVHDNFKKYLLKCGFENKGFSLHSFRRTFITRLYEANKNVKECMEITGHKNITQFMTYIDTNENSIIETINSL